LVKVRKGKVSIGKRLVKELPKRVIHGSEPGGRKKAPRRKIRA